ncbi:IMPACT family member yigZ [Actinomyces howellii]|uniref:IMPACT family member yigZ n=2 Tax=Actinomyces howellii TaxID=52771 RepID=A0A3S4R2L9_9ACTO|nr:YigZ family protein [Actinomyces howellii]VEG27079.1 IMPACT family member yigZ [Actinomyces howellii]
MLTVARGEQPEIDLEVKRSHFLGRACRADSEEEARAFIASVRARYPDARHHCHAFIVGRPGAQAAATVERSSDDGEPPGTAGQPMLEVLRGSGLGCTVVVVTRYFGGTLLGAGGLVRAYSEATARALEACSRVRMTTRHLWEVRVPVAEAGRLEAGLRARGEQRPGESAAPAGIGVEGTTWGASEAVLLVSSDDADAAALAALVSSLTRGRACPAPAGTRVLELPAD